MKQILTILTIFTILINSKAYSQGCVAIRSNGNTCSMGKPQEVKGWQLNINNRYFKSYKHFVGTEEQKQRVEEGSEVINHSFSTDFSITRTFNKFWSLAMNVPVISNTRSSKYEHYGNSSTSPNARNSTHSFGLGDVRLTAYCWLFDPAKSHKGNIQVGMGLKLPTGNYQVTDYFHKQGAGGKDSTAIGPVDQSIQLGDGGTGVALEINSYKNFNHKWSIYGNFYYLVNPMEQNGTSTSRGSVVSAVNIQYNTNTMSVPDQYMVRGGASYMPGNFTISGGVRIECIPSSDLIGGDRGFRRPGYVISAEPTFSYRTKKGNFYLSIPVAVQRNRTKSYADKLRSVATNTDVHGDAAFSDYTINAGFSIKF
jgi:hypothetical protein